MPRKHSVVRVKRLGSGLVLGGLWEVRSYNSRDAQSSHRLPVKLRTRSTQSCAGRAASEQWQICTTLTHMCMRPRGTRVQRCFVHLFDVQNDVISALLLTCSTRAELEKLNTDWSAENAECMSWNILLVCTLCNKLSLPLAYLIDQRRRWKRLYNSGNSLLNSLPAICYGNITSLAAKYDTYTI